MLLYLITDDAGRSPEQLETIVRQAICGGVTAVQLREKSASPELLEDYAARISKVCRGHSASFFLNADLLGKVRFDDRFDGLHCSQRTFPTSVASPAIGYSAHGPEEAARVLAKGSHFVTISPVFDSSSKSGILPAGGLDLVRSTRAACGDATVIALGGIAPDNAEEAMRAGADGVAVISAIFASSEPESAAAALRGCVDSYRDAGE